MTGIRCKSYLVTLCLLSGTMANAAAAAHQLGKEFDVENFIEFVAHSVRQLKDAIPSLEMADSIRSETDNGGKR